METSTLPPAKKVTPALRKLAFLLSQKFSPLRIYEFSQGFLWNLEVPSGQATIHCLVMITKDSARVDYQVQDYVNSRIQDGTVTIICHDSEAICRAVFLNSRFFITVLRYGKLFYSDGQTLACEPVPNYDFSNAVQRAEELFSHRMPLAHGFFAAAMECHRLGHHTIGTFLLHQCTEQALICMVRVHLGYRSEFHNIHRLLGLCLAFSPRPYQTLTGNDDNGSLLSILAKSYSGARYTSGFIVLEKDADALLKNVSSLLSLSAEMYHEHIKVLERLAQHPMPAKYNLIPYQTS